MRHHRPTRRTMPMRLAAGNMHNIAHLQSSRLLAFTADETIAHRHGQYLAAFVGVPECASAWGEADVVAHACGVSGY